MSWIARKIAGMDNEEPEQVIKEYFKQKNHKYLTEVQSTMDPKDLSEFWAEYMKEQDNA